MAGSMAPPLAPAAVRAKGMCHSKPGQSDHSMMMNWHGRTGGQQPEHDENTWCPYEPSAVEAATMALVHGALDTWSNDCICLEAQSSANCLVLVAEAILDRHGLVEACHLDRGTLRAFLLEIQSRYGSGQYHNSVHGADVMLISSPNLPS